MLSERLKAALDGSVRLFRELELDDLLIEKGPAFLLNDKSIEMIIAKGGGDMAQEIVDNRPEAEKYLAGLLGMM